MAGAPSSKGVVVSGFARRSFVVGVLLAEVGKAVVDPAVSLACRRPEEQLSVKKVDRWKAAAATKEQEASSTAAAFQRTTVDR
jgi:hypothetical protein